VGEVKGGQRAVGVAERVAANVDFRDVSSVCNEYIRRMAIMIDSSASPNSSGIAIPLQLFSTPA
jgi:hypothetical protein